VRPEIGAISPQSRRSRSPCETKGEEIETKREWLFPVILGVLLAGSVISFALAFVEAPPPHQEAKSTLEHLRTAPAANSTERQRAP
jgi:hypothetical protein